MVKNSMVVETIYDLTLLWRTIIGVFFDPIKSVEKPIFIFYFQSILSRGYAVKVAMCNFTGKIMFGGHFWSLYQVKTETKITGKSMLFLKILTFFLEFYKILCLFEALSGHFPSQSVR